MPGAIATFSSITSLLPGITTPSSPSTRAPLLSCLHPNPRSPRVTPEACSSPAPQSTLTTVSSAAPCPSSLPNRNTTLGPTAHLLGLHHPLLGSLTPVGSHYLNHVSKILVDATWSVGLSLQGVFPQPCPSCAGCLTHALCGGVTCPQPLPPCRSLPTCTLAFQFYFLLPTLLILHDPWAHGTDSGPQHPPLPGDTGRSSHLPTWGLTMPLALWAQTHCFTSTRGTGPPSTLLGPQPSPSGPSASCLTLP